MINSVVDDELYAEKNIWSQRYRAWRKFVVRKPRLPNDADRSARWVDNSLNKPITLGTMQGTHNGDIIRALHNIREQFEDIKELPQSLIIYGPAGSGKWISAYTILCVIDIHFFIYPPPPTPQIIHG